MEKGKEAFGNNNNQSLSVIEEPLVTYQMKNEFSSSVQHENTIQIKSEIPDTKYDIVNDNMFIKLEPIISEELHVKAENKTQAFKGFQEEHFICTMCNIHSIDQNLMQQCINCGVENPCKSDIPDDAYSVCDDDIYQSNRVVSEKVHKHKHDVLIPNQSFKGFPQSDSFKCVVCVCQSLGIVEKVCLVKTNVETPQHVATHRVQQTFKCHVCSYSCSKKSNLTKHISIHIGQKPFKCTECDYACNSKCNLQKHILTHTGEKPFACTMCEYKCSQPSSLKQHIRIHTGEKPFKCHFCDYTCCQNNNLKSHILTHTGEKLYGCNLCEYKCSLKSSLTLHSRIHTGEKPFKCDICDYACRQISQLITHKRTHTKEKPYKCAMCDFTCSVKSSLLRHVLTHTGEKRFKCRECEYICTQKSNLRRHIFRTHT